jgi:hypothetical protein
VDLLGTRACDTFLSQINTAHGFEAIDTPEGHIAKTKTLAGKWKRGSGTLELAA